MVFLCFSRVKILHTAPLNCQGSVVCHVFPPLVSIFGLFPVLVKCDYELILVQLCLSPYLLLPCVFSSCLLSLISSGLLITSRCILSLSPALSCLDIIKYYYLSLYPCLRVPVPPSCVHRDINIITICLCKITVFLLEYIFENVICSCDAKLYFQHHYFSLQCHMILQKSFFANLVLNPSIIIGLQLLIIVLIIVSVENSFLLLKVENVFFLLFF